MKAAVLLDFGSTYTKVVCVDLEENKVVLTEKFPSTVHTDALVCMNNCFDVVKAMIGEDDFNKALKLSTSSAAGGLRIAVSGLTKSLSIEAGRNASFGAGGKIVYTAAGKITEEDLREIEKSQAEIILLCGGYEKGNSSLVLENANMLSQCKMHIPVIYAGNSYISREVRTLFHSRGKDCYVAENIIPGVGKLNIESTVEIIRNIFMDRIINMKGVGDVKEYLNGPIIPTPASVLMAGELLANGTGEKEGIGPYMLFDIGGATTDVYSYCENKSFEGAKLVGTIEPFAKRTVEGDMGMRESSVCLVKEVGEEKLANECKLTTDELNAEIEKRTVNRKYIADTDSERNIDMHIACNAVRISARRHAGVISSEYYIGCNSIQKGKNLTTIDKVIATGGIIVNNQNIAGDVLENVTVTEKEEGRVLLPEKIEKYIDADYVFYAAGLLSQYEPDIALTIMKNSMKECR